MSYSSDLLRGYENAAPLPEGFNPDGKSLVNPPAGPKSACYDKFPSPIDTSNGTAGFDFHIYYQQTNERQMKYARELHERVRREFPELRVYRFWDKPIGPHPVAMFEVNVFDPQQTGALLSFFAVNRGPCSVLVHPNTGNALRDHTELATWMGSPWPLNLDIFKRV